MRKGAKEAGASRGKDRQTSRLRAIPSPPLVPGRAILAGRPEDRGLP